MPLCLSHSFFSASAAPIILWQLWWHQYQYTFFQLVCVYIHIYLCVLIYFWHVNSQSVWHGNGYDNVDMFGPGGIDLLHCCCCRASTGLATASTYTTRCCEQVRHAAAVQYSVHELPIADLYRWRLGRWRVSESALHCYSKCWTSIWRLSSKLIGYWCNKNQSAVPYKDCKQIELRTYQPAPSRVS